MASSSGNKIICVGSNFYGQLGIGGKVRSHPPFIPTQFGCTKLADNSQPSSLVKSTLHSHIAKGSGEDDELDVNNISDIQCGATYSAILEKNGQVRMCGYMHGVQHSSPVSLNLPSALICIKIACGNKHMLMLLEGGYVLSLGCGYFGQLGHGDDNSVVSTPKLISVLDPSKRYLDNEGVVTNIAAGPYTSAFVVTSNKPRGASNNYQSHVAKVHSLYMCGLNGSGQCAITAPAGTRDASEYKTILRPTLINMPVFEYNPSGNPGPSGKVAPGSSKYVTAPTAPSLGSLSSRVFPFNLGFASSSQKNAGVSFCGGIEVVLARHHTTILHIPTNRVYSWGSTLYGQLGVSTLSNNDTINVQNIGIGSGNSSAQARRRLSVPQEVHVPGVTGGVPVAVAGLNGGGSEEISTITGCLQKVGGGVSVLTYVVGLASGEHHNLMLTTSVPLTEVDQEGSPAPAAASSSAKEGPPPLYKLVPSTPGAVADYSPLTQLYSWGYNMEGQCGHSGSVAHVKVPRSIEFFNPASNLNIRSIHCGYNQCMVVVTNTLGATRPAPVLTPGCLSSVAAKKGESLLNPSPSRDEGAMIFGWGYADGGWMGAVTPPPATLPYIDCDNIVPGGQYPHSQATMFDCDCILLTPTRIKSLVPTIYGTRPTSASVTIAGSASAPGSACSSSLTSPGGSREASVSSKIVGVGSMGGNLTGDTDCAPGSQGSYFPKAVRCGYTHTVVFLQYCEGGAAGSLGATGAAPKKHYIAGSGVEVSDDSDDGAVDSKSDSKSAKEKSGGLFGKGSALAGKLSGKSSSVAPVMVRAPALAGDCELQLKRLFHVLKHHCVLDTGATTGLLDHVSGALRSLMEAQFPMGNIVDSSDANNTLLIAACKYLTRPAVPGAAAGSNCNGAGCSDQAARLQIFQIIKHIVANCVLVDGNAGCGSSIINVQNREGNTALHYCFGAHKTEDVTPSNVSMISGHTLGEYLLSLNDTSVHTTVGDSPLEVRITVNDIITNAHGLTCYEGITPEDMEKL